MQIAPSELMDSTDSIGSIDSVDGGTAGARNPHVAAGPVRPPELRQFRSSAAASETDYLADAPEWKALTQASQCSKIFVALCHGFVNAWLLASRPVTALPGPPTTVDAAYQ